MSDPVGPTSVELENAPPEMEQEAPPPPKPGEIVMHGDDVPEHLRGKTAADVLAQVKALSESLKLSEEARKQAELTAQTALRAAPVAAPEPEAKEMSDEELAQLHMENPLAAIRVMNDQAIRRAEKNLESRLKPLFSGTATAVENQARAKYPDEFALFGDQITQVASQVPNAQAVLANPAAWDDLIALVRGRPGNMERLIEKKTAGSVESARRAAQQQQADAAGFSGTEPRSRGIPTNAASLDPIQREIAEKLNMTPEEYVRWSQV